MDHVASDNDAGEAGARAGYRSDMANVDLRRLRYFVAVAEERHFGRAAARLHMSAPPLSQRIRELEADLGLTLFERSSRSVKLTAAGERLLGDARAVLAAVDRFEQSAEQLTLVATDLALGYCHGSEGGAMRALRRFREERPDVLVHPASMTSLNIGESLASGRLAVGILRGPIDDIDRVASVPLARVPVDHVAVPLGHRLADVAVVEARDLDQEPLLVVDRADAPQTHDVITGYLTRLGVRPALVTHGATQIERVFDMVAIGSGIGWLNTWQAEREAGRTDVAIRPLQPIGMWDEFRVAWRAGDTRPATAACVRVVLETCGNRSS
jgi:DNA-binding transcriptional LysR family regulator